MEGAIVILTSPVHCMKLLPCMVCWPFRVCKSCNPAHFGCHTLREPRWLMLNVSQEMIRRRQSFSNFSNTFIIKSWQFHCTCPACPVRMGVNPIQWDIPAGVTWFCCCRFHMKAHISIRYIAPANTVPICTQKFSSIRCVHLNMCDSSCQCFHWTCKYLSFQLSMVHARSLEQVFLFGDT